jgi:predicted AAA+ superfamily ATPase
MKNIISQLIDDFHERKLPEPVPRNKSFSEVKGKADVVIGMRRTGKTWFCYQKIKDLIAAGIKKEQILYLNFEDDRLLEFNVHNFQNIIDVYFGKYDVTFSLMRYSELINGKCSSGVCWILKIFKYSLPDHHQNCLVRK